MEQEEEQDAWATGFGEPEEDPELADAMADYDGRLGPEGRYQLEEGFEVPEHQLLRPNELGPKDDLAGGDDD